MNLSHLAFIIKQEADTLVSLLCLVPVLTCSRCYVCHFWVTLVCRRHGIGGQEALFANHCWLFLVGILVAHNSHAARDWHFILTHVLHGQSWLLIEDAWARFILLSVHIIANFSLVIRIRNSFISREHHAGGLLNVLELWIKLRLARILCRWDWISTLIHILILLLIPILISRLEHLLNQLLPLWLFVHYLYIERGYLIGILNANRHFLQLLIRLLIVLSAISIGHWVISICVCMRSDVAGITLVEHELGRRLLLAFCLLCHLSNFIGHRRLLVLRILIDAAILIYATNESRDVLIFAILTAAWELKLQVTQSRVSRNCYILSVTVNVYGVGKRWIGILVTASATTLLGRMSTIQISYPADSSCVWFPIHDGLLSQFLKFCLNCSKF